MKYNSPIYGKINWPWYHDAIICGIALGIIWLVFGSIPWPALLLCALIFVWGVRPRDD